ncbi:hypothetical protein GGS23DRAFT_278850 [Durotheca rogersii]|uniref:uncharacterized protein n=1 Tax=Durotheca rogersii TaxID=419775 RepID=UPI00221F4F33|nr:uncharacterized protein GGS23DRAFT_278850 [Durotheca rogersii]KAI5866602.1 hypothetical protein GGS23DRAFT_278850 [Durotheca rogersii]
MHTYTLWLPLSGDGPAKRQSLAWLMLCLSRKLPPEDRIQPLVPSKLPACVYVLVLVLTPALAWQAAARSGNSIARPSPSLFLSLDGLRPDSLSACFAVRRLSTTSYLPSSPPADRPSPGPRSVKMVRWGRGLMQLDRDYAVAQELPGMLGCDLHPDAANVEGTARQLNDGRLSLCFDRVLNEAFRSRAGHGRGRVIIILGILAMVAGARIGERHLMALRVLRPWLPTVEQQLQVVAALDGYKNDGTRWRLGSKNYDWTWASALLGEMDFDLGDEVWFSGLGWVGREASHELWPPSGPERLR